MPTDPNHIRKLRKTYTYANKFIQRYRNYRIEAYYDNALLYYSVFHRSGFECIGNFTSEDEPVDTFAEVLKRRIDEEVANRTYFKEYLHV
jgi:hypothetical protein